MELRQVSNSVVMAEELHFGRAAAKVHIAQAALSNQVLALEKELGALLFMRTTRWTELTRAGAAVYERAVRILRDGPVGRDRPLGRRQGDEADIDRHDLFGHDRRAA